MMSYTVDIKPTAQQMIKVLPKYWQTHIIARLKALETEPRPPGAIKLQHFENIYMIEENYRLFYKRLDDALRIVVLKLEPKLTADTV
jgi:mRNA interferase RelE/StbE